MGKKLISCYFFCICFSIIANSEDIDYCGTCASGDSLGGLPKIITSIDTAKVIQVFAIFPEDTLIYEDDSLTTRLLQFGDTAGYGPAQVFKNSSFGKLLLNFDVNPGLDSNYFVLPHSRQWYYTNCPDTMHPYFPGHLRQMCEDIAVGLDSLIDYGIYDSDNDGYVDYMAIDFDTIYVNHGVSQTII